MAFDPGCFQDLDGNPWHPQVVPRLNAVFEGSGQILPPEADSPAKVLDGRRLRLGPPLVVFEAEERCRTRGQMGAMRVDQVNLEGVAADNALDPPLREQDR